MLKAVVGATATIAALLVGELTLRAARFEFHLYPRVEFGWPDPEELEEHYEDDPDLFWVPEDYAERLEMARKAPPGVVFMGDSVTEFGTYPQQTIQLLHTRRPALASGVSLGVGGWSSEQGLAQLTRDVLALKPKVITIYYGWNDHWIALGPPDPELRRLTSVADRLRLVQLVKKTRMVLAADPARPNRVSLSRYRSNLETMARLGAAAGARVILLTAPSNHVRGREPEYLALRHLRRLDELVPLHQAYVEATRAAAAATPATLCDIAADLESDAVVRSSYFRADGIHLAEAGDRRVAELLAECIERAFAE